MQTPINPNKNRLRIQISILLKKWKTDMGSKPIRIVFASQLKKGDLVQLCPETDPGGEEKRDRLQKLNMYPGMTYRCTKVFKNGKRTLVGLDSKGKRIPYLGVVHLWPKDVFHLTFRL